LSPLSLMKLRTGCMSRKRSWSHSWGQH
ncbi:uncharacterized protein METZ01_LOCUS412029, partial [marine metagenome]